MHQMHQSEAVFDIPNLSWIFMKLSKHFKNQYHKCSNVSQPNIHNVDRKISIPFENVKYITMHAIQDNKTN